MGLNGPSVITPPKIFWGSGGSGAPLISPTNGYFIGGPESVKTLGIRGVLCMWQLVFALRHRLIHQQEEQQHAKRVPDGHGRSFGSWPWQKETQRRKEENLIWF